METENGYLSIKDAAAVFAIPRQKIYRWLLAGKLPMYQSARDARVKLVRREDIERLLRPVKITR